MRTLPYAKNGEDDTSRASGSEGRSPAASATSTAPVPAATSTVGGAPTAPVNSPPRPASNRSQDRVKEAEEDRALIAQAQAGDTGAFRRLVERHQRRAFAVAFAAVRDENDANEIVQDAFLRAYRNLATFQGSSSFFTWLYRIVTNLSIDLMRKPGRQTVDLDETRLAAEDSADTDFPTLGHYDGADPADMVRRGEISIRLQAALDALPSYHRTVIVLREVEGLSYEEMARAMGVSKGTIMSRLFHARQKLQRALADCYAEQIGGSPARLEDAVEVAARPPKGGA
ncbi:MAG TPA: sigma-70 family RNA polymerase sigma factor [Polyangiaceae bacterium]|nr:sigma-70 family RNA polymerase sigma factor [Polyangiaceae bacterium]